MKVAGTISDHSYARLCAAMLCVIMLCGVIFPRALAFLPGIFGILAFVSFRPVFGHFPTIPRAILLAFSAIFGLAALSSFWATDTDIALERSIKLFPLFVGAVLSISWARAIPAALLPDMARILISGFLVATVVCAADLLSAGTLHYAIRFDKDNPGFENLSNLNRGIIAVTLLSFVFVPILALQKQYKMLAIACAILLPIIVVTHSQSAQLAVLLALLLFFLFPYRSRIAWTILAAMSAFLIIVAPFVMEWLYDLCAAGLAENEWARKQASAAARLEIWTVLAERILEQPLWGYGLESTRSMDDLNMPLVFNMQESVLHPHNIVLQIWMEFGAIGAALSAALVVLALRACSALPLEQAKAVLPLLIGTMSVAAVAYGMWQGWWLGLLTLLAVLCVLSVRRLPR